MSGSIIALKFSQWLSKQSLFFKKISEKNALLPASATNTYVALNPTSEVSEDEGKTYFEAISWALQEKSINNIALTGPYGSGKSSVLLSFQANNPDLKFLNISLATFGNPEKAEEIDDKKEKQSSKIDHAAIELSILQQIFYKKSQSAIPDSRFKRIAGLSKEKLVWILSLTLIWACALTYLLDIGPTKRIQAIDIFIATHAAVFTILSYCITVLGTIFILAYFIRLIRRFNFNKIKFSSNNMEIESDGGQSILNAHFDELIYFFETTGYNGLIIEDLDRFRDTEIFTKLRELNILLNGSEQIKQKPIVFIYGIKDDLFIVGDRTKFFDFIIPMVPVVNSSNAGDYLYSLLSKNKLVGKLNQDFIYTIGLFIHDMRMVKNIFNEFSIYRKKLNIDAEDKLMGIIAYKNIYPKDFSELHTGKGLIHNVFSNKKSSVEKITANLSSEIKDLEQQIAKLQAEIAQNTKDLNAIYLLYIIAELPHFQGFYSRGVGRITISSAIETNNFNYIRAANTISYYQSGNPINSQITFQGIERQIDPNQTYEQRLALINEKESINLEDLKVSHRKKTTELLHIEGLSLAELLKSNSIENFSTELPKEKLLVYLLERGSIDELYALYISHFYEGTLKKNDQQFLIGVKNKNNTNSLNDLFALKLQNCNEILKRLSIDDFTLPDVLNFDLISWMLINKGTYKNELKLLVEQLIDSGEAAWSFVKSSRSQNDSMGSFFQYVCMNWPKFWIQSKQQPDIAGMQSEWFVSFLNCCSVEVLKEQNTDQSISTFVENNYLDIVNCIKGNLVPTKTLEAYLQELNLKIRSLSNKLPEDAFAFLTEGKFYALTYENILAVLSARGERKPNADYSDQVSISEILESEYQPLIDYAKVDLNATVTILLSNLHDKKENPLVITNLLNGEELTIENKSKIIEQLNFEIENIASIEIADLETGPEPQIYRDLLSNKKVILSWPNILSYYNKFRLDEFLLDFIISNANEISQQKLFTGLLSGQSSEIIKFVGDLCLSNKLVSDDFARVLGAFSTIDDIEELSPGQDKLRILIDKNIIRFDRASFDGIKGIEPDLAYFFIAKNITEFIDSTEAYELTAEDLIGILDQEGLQLEQQINLIKMISLDEIRRNAPVAEKVLSTIIKHDVINTSNKDLYFALVESPANGTANKIILYKWLAKVTPAETMIERLPSLGSPYDLLHGGQTEFEAEDIDAELLDYLKRAKYIDGYSVLDDKIHVSWIGE